MGQKGKPSQSLDQRLRSPGKNHNLTHFYLFSVIVILLLSVINHKNIITITTIVIIMTKIPKWPEDSLIHHLCQKYSLTMSGSAYTRLRTE